MGLVSQHKALLVNCLEEGQIVNYYVVSFDICIVNSGVGGCSGGCEAEKRVGLVLLRFYTFVRNRLGLKCSWRQQKPVLTRSVTTLFLVETESEIRVTIIASNNRKRRKGRLSLSCRNSSVN